jgi:GIY-YIG catalytic domain
VYKITCVHTKKVYVGEASNVLDRLATHFARFRRGIHDFVEMQQDWSQYGLEGFTATIVVCGLEWEAKDKRLAKEDQVLRQYDPEAVYNSHPLKEKNVKNFVFYVPAVAKNYRMVCEICGQLFDSINNVKNKVFYVQAVGVLGESETDIRRKLNNSYPGYRIIERVVHGYSRIMVNGTVYESVNDALAAGEANSRSTAIRYLKNPDKPNWSYLDK